MGWILMLKVNLPEIRVFKLVNNDEISPKLTAVIEWDLISGSFESRISGENGRFNIKLDSFSKLGSSSWLRVSKYISYRFKYTVGKSHGIRWKDKFELEIPLIFTGNISSKHVTSSSDFPCVCKEG